MTQPAPIRPRRTRPHRGDETRRRLLRNAPAPAPAPKWSPPAWPLQVIVSLLVLGGAHALAKGPTPLPVAAAPAEARAAEAAPCGPRATMRGAIRFEAPPTC